MLFLHFSNTILCQVRPRTVSKQGSIKPRNLSEQNFRTTLIRRNSKFTTAGEKELKFPKTNEKQMKKAIVA